MQTIDAAYRLLGVTSSDTPESIRTAYRRMARQWHPDVSHEPGAEERMRSLNQAYDLVRVCSARRSEASPPTIRWSSQQSSPRKARPIIHQNRYHCQASTVGVAGPQGRSIAWLLRWLAAFSACSLWLWLTSEGLWYLVPIAFCLWTAAEWASNSAKRA